MKRNILENRSEFVQERVLNWEPGNLMSDYSSPLNLLHDRKCLVLISNLIQIRKNKENVSFSYDFL